MIAFVSACSSGSDSTTPLPTPDENTLSSNAVVTGNEVGDSNTEISDTETNENQVTVSEVNNLSTQGDLTTEEPTPVDMAIEPVDVEPNTVDESMSTEQNEEPGDATNDTTAEQTVSEQEATSNSENAVPVAPMSDSNESDEVEENNVVVEPPPPPEPVFGPATNYAAFSSNNPFPPNGEDEQQDLLDHSGRVGFGSKATGGFGGEVCRVTTLANEGEGSLRNCLENDDPLWVTFDVSGAIMNSGYIEIGNNKTIDGRNADISIVGKEGLLCENSSNIIVHNIKLQGVDSGIRLREGCHTVWLDHLQIDNCYDEGIAIINGASDITISWIRINNTDKGILVGGDVSDTTMADSKITIHHNVLSAEQRNPNVRYASVHQYNNVIRNFVFEGTISSQKAEIRSERNAFNAGPNSVVSFGLQAKTHNIGDTESGRVWSFEDHFSEHSGPEGNVEITNARDGFALPYSYWATPMDSDKIKLLLENSGWFATR